jgi:hypothetical protein
MYGVGVKDYWSLRGIVARAMMFVAKPAHKAAATKDDFMFVVIDAGYGEDTRPFVVADTASLDRCDDLQRRQFARR